MSVLNVLAPARTDQSDRKRVEKDPEWTASGGSSSDARESRNKPRLPATPRRHCGTEISSGVDSAAFEDVRGKDCGVLLPTFSTQTTASGSYAKEASMTGDLS